MAPAGDIRTKARATADEIQRQLIADATCEVIAREGVEAASLRRIAEYLDCTTGLITHYFASKDDLMVRALERATERLTGRTSVGATSAVTLRGRLDAFYAALPIDGESRSFWMVLLAFRGAAIGNQRLADTYRRYSDEAMAVLQRAVAPILDRPDDDEVVREVASVINAILEGVGASVAFDPDRWTPESVTAQVDQVIAAILPGFERP